MVTGLLFDSLLISNMICSLLNCEHPFQLFITRAVTKWDASNTNRLFQEV